MQDFITEELIWALHRERVHEARRISRAGRVPEEPRDDKCWSGRPWRIVPLNLRLANCR